MKHDCLAATAVVLSVIACRQNVPITITVMGRDAISKNFDSAADHDQIIAAKTGSPGRTG